MASCGTGVRRDSDAVTVNLSYTYLNDLQAFLNSTLIEGEVYTWNTSEISIRKVADSIYGSASPLVRDIGRRSGELVTGIGLNVSANSGIASANLAAGARTAYEGTGLEKRDFDTRMTQQLLRSALESALASGQKHVWQLDRASEPGFRYVVVDGGIDVEGFRLVIGSETDQKTEIEVRTLAGEALTLEITGRKSRICGEVEEASVAEPGGEIPCLITVEVFQPVFTGIGAELELVLDRDFSESALARSLRSVSN